MPVSATAIADEYRADVARAVEICKSLNSLSKKANSCVLDEALSQERKKHKIGRTIPLLN